MGMEAKTGVELGCSLARHGRASSAGARVRAAWEKKADWRAGLPARGRGKAKPSWSGGNMAQLV